MKHSIRFMMGLGKWVQEQRIARRLTKSECAKRSGRSVQRWAQIEYEDSNRKDGSAPQPSRETCRWIAIGLGVPLAEVERAAGYAPSDEDADDRIIDEDELIAYYRGIPENLRPAARAAIKALFEQSDREDVTFGKKAE